MTVGSVGLVTAVGAGETTITATHEEHSVEKLVIVRDSLDSTGTVRVLYLVPSDVEFRADFSDAIATAVAHVLGLPHPTGCEQGSPTCDSDALMWSGYVSYPDTYLRSDEKRLLLNSAFIGRN